MLIIHLLVYLFLLLKTCFCWEFACATRCLIKIRVIFTLLRVLLMNSELKCFVLDFMHIRAARFVTPSRFDMW